MKTTLIRASQLLACGYAALIIAQFAGLLSFTVFALPVMIGGFLASALVGLAVSDYSRKPRFKVRRTAEVQPDSHTTSARECDWTYTTRTA